MVAVYDANELVSLLPMSDCIDAVESVFRAHAAACTEATGLLGLHVELGTFHIKTAGLQSSPHLFAAKINANFPGNPARHGLPTIQGVIALFDADRGVLLALMDSAVLTSRRTAAATAVAAKFLARADAGVVTICGCGEQGRSQLRALALVRTLRSAFAVDLDGELATRFATDMQAELGIPVTAGTELGAAARRSDIIVTCTTSRRAILGPGDVSPGAFVAAVGADNPDKQEIAPELMGASKVVADILDQCVVMGDLHHAIAAGVVRREDVYAELAEVVSGAKPGRTNDEEIFIFDSTGTAIEDLAAAEVVYRRAVSSRSSSG